MNRQLKICIIGKYPPIEGGVSKETYWLARGLAERGHHVHVITNAFEVEEPYRMYLEADDLNLMQGGLPTKSRGRLTVSNTSPYSSNPSFIPRTKPFVSKLAGMAARAIETHGLSLVYSYYFEPYGVAGHLSATLTGVPHIMRHAGSDFYHLSRVEPLGHLYKLALRQASGVLSTPDSEATMRGWGIPRERLHRSAGPVLPRSHFNPAAVPLDVNAFFERMQLVDAPYLDSILGRPPGRFDPSTPTIGIYGKAGPSKGTSDLVSALSLLKRRGVAFNFLAMIGGGHAPDTRDEVRRAGLGDCTWFLPFLPHWKVPSFIRACTAVCFLEREFWLAQHTPGVPREVLACGTCLVLSGEIGRKYSSGARWQDGTNVVLVEDSRDTDALASRLLAIVERPDRAQAIGRHGWQLSMEWDDQDDVLERHEEILERVVQFPVAAT